MTIKPDNKLLTAFTVELWVDVNDTDPIDPDEMDQFNNEFLGILVNQAEGILEEIPAPIMITAITGELA